MLRDAVNHGGARSQSDRAAAVFSIGAALVGGWFLNGWIFLHVQTDPWGTGFMIGMGIVGAVGFFKWQDSRTVHAFRAEARRSPERGGPGPLTSDRARFRPDRSWVAPVAILAVFDVYGLISADSARN